MNGCGNRGIMRAKVGTRQDVDAPAASLTPRRLKGQTGNVAQAILPNSHFRAPARAVEDSSMRMHVLATPSAAPTIQPSRSRREARCEVWPDAHDATADCRDDSHMSGESSKDSPVTRSGDGDGQMHVAPFPRFTRTQECRGNVKRSRTA
jgi:hypothetical protein